ncbi:Tetratricopeptide repeat protein [Stieleria neptunia]|uniref:Tetratricopeptide repeat protein n=1 Tax=Stieleria neptunia TaxID=2527979 RepID=A0A518HP63_9BACT|nr:hypothetical protein [Stieleria neptunia]QDV42567.1 Tetratricopeptide repeat protein [Stieleria neptunia]
MAYLALWSVLAGVSGCALNRAQNVGDTLYSTNSLSPAAVNLASQRLNRKGLDRFRRGDLAAAETLFREALEEDVSFGPAHNNLGQVYLARHQLYLAAWEFEYAANLMPSFPEPIVGQGLAYETGEQLERAVEFYEVAYERFPADPIAISSLVRARIKLDRPSEEIGYLLDELIMHDRRCEWVEWAKELRLTKYRAGGGTCEAPECLSDGVVDSASPIPTTMGAGGHSDAAPAESQFTPPVEATPLTAPRNRPDAAKDDFETLLNSGFASLSPFEPPFASRARRIDKASFETEFGMSDRPGLECFDDRNVPSSSADRKPRLNFEAIAREVNGLVR